MARPSLSFLIPFRDDTGDRTAVATWLIRRWQAAWPQAEFIVHSGDGEAPFSKSLAVNQAAARSTGPILAILDADIWIAPEHVTEALHHAQDGGWAVAGTMAWRLNQRFTERLFAEPPDTPWPGPSAHDVEKVELATGGLHIVPRTAFNLVGGMDERFRGWGGEDGAFKMALDTLYVPHRRFDNRMFHLWHPHTVDPSGATQWPGQTDRNKQLTRRYVDARGWPEAMAELVVP